MVMKKDVATDAIEIMRIQTGRMTVYIMGGETSPSGTKYGSGLICNSVHAKVMQGLLAPKRRSKAEQVSTAKHNPLLEFRRSLYTEGGQDTVASLPAVAFKRGMASAALDLGGATKSQLERLLWVEGEQIPLWGDPELRMDVVRNKDINRTPDVRTRACFRRWATKLTISYMMPVINPTTIANLLAGAGLIRGVGDFRQEKGAGSYGQFSVVDEDNKDLRELMATSGRAQQIKSIESPKFYNELSEDLYTWWASEMKKRGTKLETDEDEIPDFVQPDQVLEHDELKSFENTGIQFDNTKKNGKKGKKNGSAHA